MGGGMTDDRHEQLRKMPPLAPFNHSMWTEGVRTISTDEADGLGVDLEIRRLLYLSFWQKLGSGDRCWLHCRWRDRRCGSGLGGLQ
jgi:hypothetical protein